MRRPDKEDPFEPGRPCPFYVGKGSNGRIGGHRREAQALLHKPGRKTCKTKIIHKLWAASLDYEEEIILRDITEEEAFLHERQTIAAYGRVDLKTGCLANGTDGGEGASGCSEEVRKKKSEKMKGRPPSEKSIQKLKERNAANPPNKGHKWSDERRKEFSEALKGRKFSEEHKKNLSEALRGYSHSAESNEKRSRTMKGKPKSEETKKRMSEALRGNSKWKGKHHSEKSRQKIGAGHKGKIVSIETRGKLSAVFKGRTRIDGHWIKREEKVKVL